MGYQVSSLQQLGDGPGFRKIRAPLGVTAFGVNAVVYPAGYVGPAHFHDVQDELYFVHSGRAVFTIDGDVHELEAGGIVHVESTTPRQITNPGTDELVLYVVGGKGGYVERDGHLVDPEVDLPRRQGLMGGGS